MSGIPSLLAVADAYAAGERVPETTVSKRALQDSSRLTELRQGDCDIGVRRMERTLQWFADNWPPDAVWPSDVPRPAPTLVPANTATQPAPAQSSAEVAA